MSERPKLRFLKDRCQNDYFVSIFDSQSKSNTYAAFATLRVRSGASNAENKGIPMLLCINDREVACAGIARILLFGRPERAA